MFPLLGHDKAIVHAAWSPNAGPGARIVTLQAKVIGQAPQHGDVARGGGAGKGAGRGGCKGQGQRQGALSLTIDEGYSPVRRAVASGIAWAVENCDLCHSGAPGTPTQVHESTLQKAVRKAAVQAGIVKKAGCHTFRPYLPFLTMSSSFKYSYRLTGIYQLCIA